MPTPGALQPLASVQHRDLCARALPGRCLVARPGWDVARGRGKASAASVRVTPLLSRPNWKDRRPPALQGPCQCSRSNESDVGMTALPTASFNPHLKPLCLVNEKVTKGVQEFIADVPFGKSKVLITC